MANSLSLISDDSSQDSPINLSLSPSGHIDLYTDSQTVETLPKNIIEKLQSAFVISDSIGLLHLGLTNWGLEFPDQIRGVEWLWWLYNMRLGGCLADDMGLGKTIQILALLLLIKKIHAPKQPNLLVLPASLLGNWQSEAKRFAPDLSLWIAYGGKSQNNERPDLSQVDLVITTYSMLHRISWLAQISWHVVILDEAQAIKNPVAKQTS